MDPKVAPYLRSRSRGTAGLLGARGGRGAGALRQRHELHRSGVSIRGQRDLRYWTVRDGEHVEHRRAQAPGSVYLSSPAVFWHQVHREKNTFPTRARALSLLGAPVLCATVQL